MTRVIGVVSGKGGVGKTMVVSNLGAALTKRHNKNVVLVDCNITTSHLSMCLGMHWAPVTLNQVLRHEVPIEKAIYTHPSGMKIIPASLAVKDISGVSISDLKASISNLVGKTDIIILDAAPCLGKEALITMEISDEVLFVTTPFVPSAMDIVRTAEMMKDMGAVKLGIVLNMTSGAGYELTKSEIEQLTGMPVLVTVPFDKAVLKSLAAKSPIVLSDPRARPSREIARLAAIISGEQVPQDSASIFEKLMGALKIGR